MLSKYSSRAASSSLGFICPRSLSLTTCSCRGWTMVVPSPLLQNALPLASPCSRMDLPFLCCSSCSLSLLPRSSGNVVHLLLAASVLLQAVAATWSCLVGCAHSDFFPSHSGCEDGLLNVHLLLK